MVGLHPVRGPLNDTAGRFNYVVRGAIVLHQVSGLCPVLGLEPVDVLGGRSAEGVDVLVVVAHGQDAQFLVGFIPGAAGQRRDQVVLLLLNVLVLVHQDPPESGHDAVPLLVGLRTVGALALQNSGGLDENVVEEVGLCPAAGWHSLLAAREGPAGDAHGKGVAGHHDNTPGFLPDKLVEPLANLYAACRL